MSRSQLRLGLVVVVTYALIAAATSTWSPGRMRPLFDGFGTHPGAYHWVNPPPEFVDGNQPPTGAEGGVAFDPEGSRDAGVATQDSQALMSIQRDSVPPHPPDSSAVMKLRPVDSAELGPLPAGLRAEGNAYRVTVDYLPSRTPVTTLTKPGNLVLTAVAPVARLLFTPDGKGWQVVDAGPIAQGNGITGGFTEPGYYLAAGKGTPRPASSAGSKGRSPGFYILLAAVPLALVYLLFRIDRGQGTRREKPRTATSPSRNRTAPPRQPVRKNSGKRRKKGGRRR